MADAAFQSDDEQSMRGQGEVIQPSSSARSRRAHGFDEEDLESVRTGLNFCSEEEGEEPDNWDPVRQRASATGRGGRRKGDGNELELARTKRDPKRFCLEVYGQEAVEEFLESHVDIPGDMKKWAEALQDMVPLKCKGRARCGNREGCVSKLGGLQHCYALRCKMWPVVEVVQPRAPDAAEPERGRKSYKRNKGAPRQARKDKMFAYMQDSITITENRDEGTTKMLQRYRLRAVDNSQVAVCKTTWHQILGIGAGHSSFRTMLRKLQKKVMDGAVADDDLRSSGQGVAAADFKCSPFKQRRVHGTKRENTISWFVNQVEHFSDPQPHRDILELHFPNWKTTYAIMAEHYGDDVDAPKRIVSEGWFRRIREDDPRVRAAVQATLQRSLGRESYQRILREKGPLNWKIACKDPLKNVTFGRCKVCCANETAKTKAARDGKKDAYIKATEAYDLHHKDFMSRRTRHNDSVKEAKEKPTEVLAVCLDGIDKRKMQGPVLPGSLRRDKDIAQMKRFPYTMVGAIAHGHERDGDEWAEDRSHRFMIFYDGLLGNNVAEGVTGAGSNETLTTLMAVLEHLKEADKLPTSTTRRKLCLQVDNCGNNKNQTVIAFCALLVATDMFTEVDLDFLLVGHTHVLIDQWFRVLSQAMFTTSQRVWTTPQLQAFFRNRFHCTVFNLDCFMDFQTLMDTMRASMTGHSAPYAFRFGRHEGRVVGEYQTSQNTSGDWYEMEVPLKTMPSTNVFDIGTMQLKPMTDDLTDELTKLVDKLAEKVVNINKTHDFMGTEHMDGEWVEWWSSRLEQMRNEEELERRVEQPNLPIRSTIELKIPNIGREAADPAPTARAPLQRREAEEHGLLPTDRGPILRVIGGAGVAVHASVQEEEFADRVQDYAHRIREGLLEFSELPALGDLIAWEWHVEGDKGFALGRLVTSAAQSTPEGGSRDWTFSVASYMPREWEANPGMAKDAAAFARADFAPEVRTEETTVRRRKRARVETREVQHVETISVSNVVLCSALTKFPLKLGSRKGAWIRQGGKINTGARGHTPSDVQSILEFACEHWPCTTSEENARQCRVCARALGRREETASRLRSELALTSS